MHAEGHTRLASSRPLSHVRIAFSDNRVAFPGDNNSISVWEVGREKQLVAKLSGHVGEVSAICFGEGVLAGQLFSCSDKDAFQWDIEANSGTKLALPAGPAVHVAVSCTALLAVCMGRSLLLHNLTANTRAGKLEGHGSAVGGCVFSPTDPNLLISISEDRTFIVWDCAAQTLVYRSFVLGSLPLLTIATTPAAARAAIGDAGGGLHVIDLARGDYRVMHSHSLGPALRGEIAVGAVATPSPAPAVGPASKSTDSAGEVEGGAAIVGLTMFTAPLAAVDSDAASAFAAVRTTTLAAPLHTCLRLLACSSSAALLLDPHTYRVEARIPLAGPDSSTGLPFLAAHFFSAAPDGLSLACASCAAFEPALYLWSLALPAPTRPAAAVVQPTPEPLSILSTAALLEDSPLQAKIAAASRPKTDPAAALRARATHAIGAKQGKVVDKPLTFHSKIKSSGYGAAPPRKMFQPLTKAPPPARRASDVPASQPLRAGGAEYPVASPPPCNPGRDRVGLGAPVTSMTFSSDGRYLAAAISDKSVQIVRCPFGSSGPGSVRAFVGHSGAVSSVDFSNDGSHILTAASDNTARIWHAAKGETVLAFERRQHNRSIAREGEAPNAPLKAIARAQFFYLDRFVLVASLHQLLLYSYAIDTSVDDVKRYLSSSRYTLSSSIGQPGPHSITTFAAANGFLSHVVLSAGSDKSVCVMDLNAARPARILPDVHRRPVTHIALNSGSAFVAHPPAAYDLFLTTAVSDGVNMWDLRAERCVRRFDAHSARQPVSAAFSPCGRYVACGSEDRAVYLYDIRTGSVLSKLGGHTDVACHVAFSPVTPTLVSGSADGFLREFVP